MQITNSSDPGKILGKIFKERIIGGNQRGNAKLYLSNGYALGLDHVEATTAECSVAPVAFTWCEALLACPDLSFSSYPVNIFAGTLLLCTQELGIAPQAVCGLDNGMILSLFLVLLCDRLLVGSCEVGVVIEGIIAGFVVAVSCATVAIGKRWHRKWLRR